MVRTDQGGSVLGFVVIGIVMAALLVGGIFAMQQSRITPGPTPAPQQPNEQPADQKPAEKPSEEKEKPAPQPTPQSAQQQAPAQLPSNGPMHEMPQTGPVETMASAIAVLLVSGVLIAYIRSRRQLASL